MQEDNIKTVGDHRVLVNDAGNYECADCGVEAAKSDSGIGDYLDRPCDSWDSDHRDAIEDAVRQTAHGQAITMIEDGHPETDGKDVAVENALDTFQNYLDGADALDAAKCVDREELRPIARDAVEKAYAGETTNLDELRGGE